MRALLAVIGVALAGVAALGAPSTAVGIPTGEGKPGGARLVGVGQFDQPTYVAGAPGAKRLLFVVERPGRIRLVRRGRALRRPFLDIANRVRTSGTEEGLFSVAFAPSYRRSGRFFVYYTNTAGDNQVDSFRRSRRDPTRAAPRSRRSVIRLPHPAFENHNGGQLQFGPDGYLYLGTGDGGGAADPPNNAQSTNSLLGKLLRIDPRPRGGYAAPPDNPFVGGSGRDEIYALGLRNPWRFSFDRGRIVIGDVGQFEWEEVDYETLAGAAGANFGWDAYEGSNLFLLGLLGGTLPPPSAEPPIHEYSHAGGNCSITGGYVVRDRRLPSLFGRYVYADFCAGQLRSLVPRLDGARDDRALGLSRPGISSFGTDRIGRIYVTSLGGGVWRLAPN